MTFGLALPSAYTAWTVVQESRFRSAARRFVAEQLNFADQTTLHVDLTYRRDSSSIEATLIGEPMTSAAVDSLKQRLPSYGLSRTRLALRQPFSKQLSPGQIAELVREGLQQSNDARLERGPEPYSGAQDALIRTLQDEASRLRARELPTAAVTQELAALYPALNALGVSRLAPVVVDTSTSAQQILGVVLQWRRLPSAEERRRVQSWLVVRLQADSVELTNVLVR
jgi:hypothetical protein